MLGCGRRAADSARWQWKERCHAPNVQGANESRSDGFDLSLLRDSEPKLNDSTDWHYDTQVGWTHPNVGRISSGEAGRRPNHRVARVAAAIRARPPVKAVGGCAAVNGGVSGCEAKRSGSRIACLANSICLAPRTHGEEAHAERKRIGQSRWIFSGTIDDSRLCTEEHRDPQKQAHALRHSQGTSTITTRRLS